MTVARAEVSSSELKVPPLNRQWQASLDVAFSHTAQGTRLSSIKRNGPLSVQKPFYPQGPECAHLYLLHPPAGIVSGDVLRFNAQLNTGAHALLTTPGANRFYRARTDHRIGESTQRQIASLRLESTATLEHFPLETIVYDGADAVNQVDVYMDSRACYMGWDIVAMGLPASEQPFIEGAFTQVNRIFVDGQLHYHDRINITAQNQLLQHPAGLAGNSVFGSFVILAPSILNAQTQRAELIEQIRQKIAARKAENKVSITDINGLLLARYLGAHCEEAKQLFIEIWHLLRPLLCEQQAAQPRIWFT